MFERFTTAARHVIVCSQEEARDLDHNYIGTEHLLLGLFAEPGEVAARALERFDVTADSARKLVVESVKRGKKPVRGHIPFTPRAKKALELSLREALALHHDHITSGHLLLGLLRLGEGLGFDVLVRLEVSPERLRQTVVELFAAHPAPRRPAAGPSVTLRHGDRTTDVPATRATEDLLVRASRLAGVDGVGSHHLMLAALSDRDSAAVKAMNTLGLPVGGLRDALRAVDVAGTSDELPEQAGRRLMSLRVVGERLVLEASDATLVERARAAAEALGGSGADAIAGADDSTISLATVWSALVESLRDIERRAPRAARPGGEPATVTEEPAGDAGGADGTGAANGTGAAAGGDGESDSG